MQIGNLSGAPPFFVAILWKACVSLAHCLNFGMDRWGTPVVCKWHQCWMSILGLLYRMFEENLGFLKDAGFMPLISPQRFTHIIVSSTSLVFVLLQILNSDLYYSKPSWIHTFNTVPFATSMDSRGCWFWWNTVVGGSLGLSH